MTQQIILSMIGEGQIPHECRITIDSAAIEGRRTYWLTFTSDVTGAAQFEGMDAFPCLVDLRHHLERLGYRLLCNGARPNVWPSPMSRQSGGDRIYVLEFGKPASLADLVWTFDPTTADKVGTVAEQRAFVREWFDSLGAHNTDDEPSDRR